MTNCPSDADYPDNPAQSGVAPRPEADALPARVVSIVRNRRRSNKPPRQNDSRPTIRLAAGDIERIVDDAEAALIKADRGLYQRANQIVFVAETPVKASRGRDVLTLRIFERGDHALREDLATSANFERYDARAKDFVSV